MATRKWTTVILAMFLVGVLAAGCSVVDAVFGSDLDRWVPPEPNPVATPVCDGEVCVAPRPMVAGAQWAAPGSLDPDNPRSDPAGWTGGTFDEWGNFYSADGTHCAQPAIPQHPCLNGYVPFE